MLGTRLLAIAIRGAEMPQQRGGRTASRRWRAVNALGDDPFRDDEVAEYRRLGLWGDECLPDLIDRVCAERPDTMCSADSNQGLTWAQVRERAWRLAGGLSALGIRPGDRIVVQLHNAVEAVVVYFAVGRLGAVMVPRMTVYRESEIAHAVDATEARALIVPATFRGFDFADMGVALARRCPTLEHVLVAGDAPAGTRALSDLWEAAPYDGPRPHPDSLHVIVYSSGTTARPKGAAHSFNTYVACARGLARALGLTSRGRLPDALAGDAQHRAPGRCGDPGGDRLRQRPPGHLGRRGRTRADRPARGHVLDRRHAVRDDDDRGPRPGAARPVLVPDLRLRRGAGARARRERGRARPRLQAGDRVRAVGVRPADDHQARRSRRARRLERRLRR